VTLSRTFRVSAVLSALGIGLLVLLRGSANHGFLGAVAILLVVLAGPVFAVSAARYLIRSLLWRVGSRLLVSYFLIGVMPIPLVAGLLFAGTLVLCGQLAGRRVEEALRSEAKVLRAAAEGFAPACRSDVPARHTRFEALRAERKEDLPGLEYVVWPGVGAPDSSADLPPVRLEPAMASEEAAIRLARWHDSVYLVAPGNAGDARLALAVPLGPGLSERLRAMTGIRVGFATAVSKRIGKNVVAGMEEPRKSGAMIETPNETVRFKALAAGPASPSPSSTALTDREWVHWLVAVDAPIRDWESGEPVPDGRLAVTVHSSVGRELRTLFGNVRIGSGSQTETGALVFKVMKAIALFTLTVYLLALLVAGFLVLRIVRATGRLSKGFAEIDRGNFAARVSLRGRDQLAELAESFNEMASHLQASVSEKASHEVIERELETARTLQRRLLPPPDFSFPGLQIAVDFRPTSAIGGDFYHFLSESPDRLTVVVADASGHGLSTGIVMASAKASLSAFATTSHDAIAVLTTLDEEIRRTTDSRTFVTLAHLRFLFDEELVEFTNAGHVYPYRVEPLGAVTALENPSRPLGVRLPGNFTTVRAPLVPGDLWILLSDGIVEALSPAEEVFGFPRLESLLARGAGGTAVETRDRVLSAWRDFTGGDLPADDRTLLVLKVVRRDQA
jgi:serine phosphatase RsbU (regulator of sigma subunit)